MRRHIRNSSDPSKSYVAENGDLSRAATEIKYWLDPMKSMGIFVAILMVSSVFFSLSVILQDPKSDGIWTMAEARVLEVNPQQGSEDVDSSQHVNVSERKLLGGLLSDGFEERSCLSRYQSVLYRKELGYKPSSYLLSRLRSYEALHKRCGPYTESYNKSVEKLKSGQQTGPSDCNYVVWIAYSGLGNRILTLASAFLYALITNKVLLVDRGVDMVDLFCEPFPEASWLLPLDFPLAGQFNGLDQKSPQSYGNMLNNNLLANSSSSMYVHLVHDYDKNDKLFFCDQDQAFLQTVPWLIMKTDNYFIPSLYLIDSFEKELNDLFPEKDRVFHFLGRYLFHPTNQVWGLISRYYEAYLAKADEKIGIQIRVFDTRTGPFQYILDQILACTMKENLLPDVNANWKEQQHMITQSGNQTRKAVLVTSLSSGYFEKIRDLYWEYPTATGEVVGVFQPSNEGYQQTEKRMHNKKAWAEMYLLSLTDKLVTSPWSTFGYVAQGLGGLKPWIMFKPENQTTPNPPCRRAMSMEPCFHAPPFYDCKKKTGIDTGLVVPHVRHCEDMSWGLKLVDDSSFE